MVKRGKRKTKTEIRIEKENNNKESFYKRFGLGIFLVGLFAMFLSIPLGNITGNVIAQGNSGIAALQLYLIGFIFMIFGAVLLEYGQKQQQGPNPAYAQTLKDHLYVKHAEFARSLQEAGYRVEWGFDKITVINPTSNTRVLTIPITKSGVLSVEDAKKARKTILENLVGSEKTAELLGEKVPSRR